MALTIEISSEVEIALNRLRNEKNEIGSFDKLAEKYGVNVRYVWDFIHDGVVPKSRKVCKKLGIPVRLSPVLQATRRRIAKANQIARAWGYKSWSEYTTQMIRVYEGYDEESKGEKPCSK